MPLNYIPLEAMFKTKTSGLNTSILIHLKIDPSLRSVLTRLEVRVPVPAGNQISGISTAPNTIIGTVSIQKDDTQLLWNLTSLLSNNRLKEEVTMNVGIETIRPVSLVNVQSAVSIEILNTICHIMMYVCMFKDHICRNGSYFIWSPNIFGSAI